MPEDSLSLEHVHGYNGRPSPNPAIGLYGDTHTPMATMAGPPLALTPLVGAGSVGIACTSRPQAKSSTLSLPSGSWPLPRLGAPRGISKATVKM